MSFQELQSILGAIEPHYHSPERQQLRRILEHWTDLIGADLAAQAQPIAIQRNILEVATSSPVWTQTLVFKRPSILKQIRDRFAIDLSDIRFSTVQWRTPQSQPVIEGDLWQNHPSQLPAASQVTTQLPLFNDSRTAFERWSALIQHRSQHLPLCPNCKSPTPPGELERWTVCSLCAARNA
ncbi:DciA family protein [Leptolyngbya sp. GGD]|uniref:DciA family protein n=1 Tax=Leptolyngbya sp. GGD TaxID=2997907 RepID=UPI00227B7D7A|nr:DciA family protein [Leptolyngbya sp. GGD]MCY6494473.1 DciA family protein [Leptolyngbya sp. GGD]